MYLLDTNIISEYRKGHRANAGVQQFFATVDPDILFLPVQVIGEIHAGIAKLLRSGGEHELDRARQYRQWVDALVEQFTNRILPFDLESTQLWGVLLSGEKKDPHTIDKQIAAIAMTNDLTVVTRDKGEAFSTIATLKVFNPFQQAPLPPSTPPRLN